MTGVRIFAFLLAVSFIAVAGFIVSLFARGYRLDTKNLGIRPSGILVATSVPQGAQILINGDLESATNTTLYLPPDSYDIEIKKESFLAWKKRITIKKEEVTKADALLFPAVPSLSALTSTGVIKPILSPDGTKIAYGVPGDKSEKEQKTGIWVMELADLPIGFSREPKQVTDVAPENAAWGFSPDSREILLTTPNGNFIISSGSMTPQTQLVNLPADKLKIRFDQWKKEEDKRLRGKLEKLPKEMQDILARKTKALEFSPDENKVLYTASGSAQIPDNLIPPLPGSSTQQQERNIKDGKTYVYDIKEDRNFFITDLFGMEEQKNQKTEKQEFPGSSISKFLSSQGSALRWFPTSNHLVLAEPNKITIMDYDGTNRQVVWATPYEAPYVIPSPNTQQLLILTSLGAGNGMASNLYALRLR